jgi:hypothetical protein
MITKKKLPKSARKHIRKEKARLRRANLTPGEKKRQIAETYRKFRPAKAKPTKAKPTKAKPAKAKPAPEKAES